MKFEQSDKQIPLPLSAADKIAATVTAIVSAYADDIPIEDLARDVFGEPNHRLSKRDELRFGRNGSVSVDLEECVWFDHEAGKGGGYVDLAERAGVDISRPANKGIAATYDYRAADGTLAFQVVRKGNPKTFKQRRADGNGGWIEGKGCMAGVELVPYRLPELLNAPAGSRVYIVEGEKDCDALHKLGLTATTNPGGAGKWRASYNQFFRGRHVAILPDNDPQKTEPDGTLLWHPDGRPIFAGQDHASEVAGNLRDIAASVRVLMLPDLPLKGDVSDWLGTGGTREELERLVDASSDGAAMDEASDPQPELTPKPEPANDDASKPAAWVNGLPPILSLSEFMATFKTPDYIIDGILQRGRLYALTSPTGHGKTAVAQYLGLSIAAGRNIGNIEVEQGAVIFLAGENPDDLCARMHAACQFYGMDPAQTPLHVMPGNFPLTAKAAETLKQAIDAKGLSLALIVFDTAAAFFPGADDNVNVPMGDYARQLRVLLGCRGYPAVLTPAHPVKNPDKDNLLPRGGGGFLNELDGNLTLWSDSMGEHTTLHWQGKLRAGDFAPVHFALHQVKIAALTDRKGRPIVSVLATLQTPEQADEVADRNRGDENHVLKMLKTHPGISIREIAVKAGWVSKAGVPNTAKVHRLFGSLKRDNLVSQHRKKWRLTSDGSKEIKAAKPETLTETE